MVTANAQYEGLNVINFFGGPSSTKSTTAVGVFHEMKRQRYSVEYVSEFAKDLVWDERFHTMKTDQLYIFGEQNHRLQRLIGKVQYAVTDTSLLYALIYGDAGWEPTPHLKRLALAVYDEYVNYNYFIERPVGEFETPGRAHNEEESIALDTQIKAMLAFHAIPYKSIPAGRDSVLAIIEDIKTLRW